MSERPREVPHSTMKRESESEERRKRQTSGRDSSVWGLRGRGWRECGGEAAGGGGDVPSNYGVTNSSDPPAPGIVTPLSGVWCGTPAASGSHQRCSLRGCYRAL